MRLSWKYQFIKPKYSRKASNFKAFVHRLFVTEKKKHRSRIFSHVLAMLQTYYNGVLMDTKHKYLWRFLNVFCGSIYVLCPRDCRSSLETDWTNFLPSESLIANWCITNASFARVSWLFLQEFKSWHFHELVLMAWKYLNLSEH